MSFCFSYTRAATIETAQTLPDHTIEENEIPANDKNDTENDVEQTESIPLDATDKFSNFQKSSMAIYYAWQIVCLLIFIFTAYETLQSV